MTVLYCRFYKPETIDEPVLILCVGIAGLVINIIGLFLFHGNSTKLSQPRPARLSHVLFKHVNLDYLLPDFPSQCESNLSARR